ncbi:MAG: hypothetical protein WDW38_001039 [Sanguina aurantia]
MDAVTEPSAEGVAAAAPLPGLAIVGDAQLWKDLAAITATLGPSLSSVTQLSIELRNMVPLTPALQPDTHCCPRLGWLAIAALQDLAPLCSPRTHLHVHGCLYKLNTRTPVGSDGDQDPCLPAFGISELLSVTGTLAGRSLTHLSVDVEWLAFSNDWSNPAPAVKHFHWMPLSQAVWASLGTAFGSLAHVALPSGVPACDVDWAGSRARCRHSACMKCWKAAGCLLKTAAAAAAAAAAVAAEEAAAAAAAQRSSNHPLRMVMIDDPRARWVDPPIITICQQGSRAPGLAPWQLLPLLPVMPAITACCINLAPSLAGGGGMQHMAEDVVGVLQQLQQQQQQQPDDDEAFGWQETAPCLHHVHRVWPNLRELVLERSSMDDAELSLLQPCSALASLEMYDCKWVTAPAQQQQQPQLQQQQPFMAHQPQQQMQQHPAHLLPQQQHQQQQSQQIPQQQMQHTMHNAAPQPQPMYNPAQPVIPNQQPLQTSNGGAYGPPQPLSGQQQYPHASQHSHPQQQQQQQQPHNSLQPTYPASATPSNQFPHSTFAPTNTGSNSTMGSTQQGVYPGYSQAPAVAWTQAAPAAVAAPVAAAVVYPGYSQPKPAAVAAPASPPQAQSSQTQAPSVYSQYAAPTSSSSSSAATHNTSAMPSTTSLHSSLQGQWNRSSSISSSMAAAAPAPPTFAGGSMGPPPARSPAFAQASVAKQNGGVGGVVAAPAAAVVHVLARCCVAGVHIVVCGQLSLADPNSHTYHYIKEVLEHAQAARATSVAFLQPGTGPGMDAVTEPSAEGVAAAAPLPGLAIVGDGACSVNTSLVDTSPWLVWW